MLDTYAPLLADETTDGRASSDWFASRWLAVFLALCLGACVAIALVFPEATAFAAGEVALWLAFVGSLRILSKERLLNPAQTGALLFYVWFGLGPLVVLLFGLAAGVRDEAWQFYPQGTTSLPFVACGLPLYAFAARAASRLAARRGWTFQWFAAGKTSLEPRTLVILFVLGGGLALLLEVLPALGIHGITTVGYLGAKRTDIWWVGVLDSLSAVLALANVVAISSIVAPRLRSFPRLPLLGFAILLFLLSRSFSSGWKEQFVFPLAWLAIAFLTERQRPPLLLMAALTAFFLLFLEPFVHEARNQALSRGVTDPAGRIQVFEEVLGNQLRGVRREPDAALQLLHVRALFRDIFPLAGAVLERGGAAEGPWHGETIARAVTGIIPRAFYPDKPDLDVGPFFARETSDWLGHPDPLNTEHSAAISIPIEIAGNFGWIAGVLAFPLLGFVWALLAALALGPDPALHPWNPYFVLSTLVFEAPVVTLLAEGRNLVLLAGLVALVWRLRGRRL